MCKGGHICQIFIAVLFVTLVISSSYLIFGKIVAMYLISGVSLGFGIALQPLFKNIINGLIFHAIGCDGDDVSSVNIKGFTGKICRVGLIHTWVELETKEPTKQYAMISNALLESNIIKVNTTTLKNPTSSKWSL
jgi:hypothetical protein